MANRTILQMIPHKKWNVTASNVNQKYFDLYSPNLQSPSHTESQKTIKILFPY